MKILVTEKKGSSFRLLDLENNISYRAMQKDFKNLFVGSLLTVSNFEAQSDLIISMTIDNEIVGDSSKKRIEVDTAVVKVGDLIDNVPVLKFGQAYAKAGKKVAYAYFN